MRGHGAVIVGNSIPTVVGRSVYLDINAKAQTQALAWREDQRTLDPEERGSISHRTTTNAPGSCGRSR
jgi:ribulose-5-phosphate 4-epimerase/fuculose-1-phosphate aldolase